MQRLGCPALGLLGASFMLLASPAGATETASSPLVQAEGGGPVIEYQVGADGMAGLTQGDADWLAGVNASLLVPISDSLRLGLRPALHYVTPVESDMAVTWMHVELAGQFDLLQEPVRLYLLGLAGYSLAVDNDLGEGVAHGFGGAFGVGVAWQSEGAVGLFAELAFRYGSASGDSSRLVLDASGNPTFDEDSRVWLREEFTREYELTAVTLNLGLRLLP